MDSHKKAGTTFEGRKLPSARNGEPGRMPAAAAAGKLRIIGVIDPHRVAQPDVRERMFKMVCEPAAGMPQGLSDQMQADTRYRKPLGKTAARVVP
jgi:hypothetical protein